LLFSQFLFMAKSRLVKQTCLVNDTSGHIKNLSSSSGRPKSTGFTL
jgi:hypothetical protein